MNTQELFMKLFSVLGTDSKDYFVSGSLSFLPLLQYYRKPGKDIDVSIEQEVFQVKEEYFRALGNYHVLNVQEVAVANTSPIAKIIHPKTGFIHIDIGDGLLDITVYKEHMESIELLFGMGFTLELTKELLQKKKKLIYEGIPYYSAPIEMMLVTKSVEYLQAIEKETVEEFEKSKHYDDICRMAAIADWDFAEILLNSLRVKWYGRYLPAKIENKINPYRKVKIQRLRSLL